jgi:hypothetical protein
METSPTFMLDRDYSRFTLKEKVSLLRELWERLYSILDTYFSGYLVMPDEKLNSHYVKICLIIEKVLVDEEFSPIRELWERYRRPFESLYAQWDEGDIYWKDGGVKKRTLELKGAIDEAFIKLGEPKFADLGTDKFLSEVDNCLASYAINKKAKEARWVKNVEKQTEKFREESQPATEPERPKKGRLGFIKD